MTMVEHRRESLHVTKNKKRCKKQLKVRRRDPIPEAVLPRLFVSCRDVFKGHGTVPCSDDVAKLCRILGRWLENRSGNYSTGQFIRLASLISGLLDWWLEKAFPQHYIQLIGSTVTAIQAQNGMRPEDVGLSRDLQFFNPKNPVKGNPRVTYTTIYQCDKFSMCIFFLPATAVIPLHNHPEMTVFSKLLLGTMHIKSFDWADSSSSNDSLSRSRRRLAKVKADCTFTAPCDTSVLYPTSGGNIHAFTAITPCAFLDVIGPPYSKDDGRDCSYYKEIIYSAVSNRENVIPEELESDSYRWLEEIEMPEDSHMDGIEYLGPPII